MANLTWDIRQAIGEARRTLESAQENSRQIGYLASDPMILRNMSGNDLARIKKQLQKFNAKTHTWNEE